MITNYYRPQTLEEAITLLEKPGTKPLAGGTLLSLPSDDVFDVVDLQALGLNKISKNGNNLEFDACVTLQQILESEICPDSLKNAIRIEAGLNIRNAATIAGTLAACDGRSAVGTVMLGFDAKLQTISSSKTNLISLGDYFPFRQKIFMTKIIIPVNVKSSFESVGRSQFDKPIVSACVVQWNGGRTRLALGGYKNTPLLAMDGTEAEGLSSAANNAFHEAGDQWATSEYRSSTAAALAVRCLNNLK